MACVAADERDVDLAPLVEEFAGDPVSLHARKRGHVMKSNAQANDAAHVRAALDWCLYDQAKGEAGRASLKLIENAKDREREYRNRVGARGAGADSLSSMRSR